MVTICQVESDYLSIRTENRLQLVDITPRVKARISNGTVREGVAVISSLHTTFALFINEVQDALIDDIGTFLAEFVSEETYWKHNDPQLSDCDRQNATAHLRASLLGHSLTVPIQHGELLLGTFQSIIAAELDGPRQRSIHVQTLGM